MYILITSTINNDKEFQHSTTDTDGTTHNVGDFTNDTSDRTTSLPRFQRNDLQSNLYIYRSCLLYTSDAADE